MGEYKVIPGKQFLFLLCRYTSVAILLAVSLIACESPITFTEPQPADTRNLTKFPKRLQGEYINFENRSVLEISDHLIIRTYNFYFKSHKNQLNLTHQLSGDSVIINIETGDKVHISIEGDSILQYVRVTDTIFQINREHILRKFKGYYFLNSSLFGNTWEVMKLEQSKGQLIVSTISEAQDIERLREITETPEDTIIQRQFSLTKKQFKRFVRKEGFTDGETFIKQKNK